MMTSVFIPITHQDYGKRIVLKTDLDLVMAVANHLGANGYSPPELDQTFWMGERQFYRFTVEDENAALLLRLKFDAIAEEVFMKNFNRGVPRRAIP